MLLAFIFSPEVHSWTTCCVCGAVLASWEAAGGKADTESEAAVSSLCGCGTWGWQHCGGAAESEPQPIGLSWGGCLALAGCLPWDRRGGGPCCVHGSPQFAALLRLIPQGSRAGAPPLPWFVVWKCEAQWGLRCPHPMGLRSVLCRLLKQALNLTRAPPLLPGTLTWLSLLY